MATTCPTVETSDLGPAVGRGALRCLEALAERFGREIGELTVAIQGAGFIGRSVARAYAGAGASLLIADLVPERARALCDELGARFLPASQLASTEMDVLAPCGLGGTVTVGLANTLGAWGICGAANAQLAGPAAASALRARRIEHVPGALAGAGAVIQGIGRTRMGLSDPGVLIDELRATTSRLLEDADRAGRTPSELAEEWAWERIELGRS
jgi:leucine dehydrogenase